MNLKLLVIVFPFLIVSCNRSIQSQDIVYENYKYYYKNKLINGEKEIIENQYKSVFNFKDGIPQGKWKEYGIKNEIILEGNIKQLSFNGCDSNIIKRVFLITLLKAK